MSEENQNVEYQLTLEATIRNELVRGAPRGRPTLVVWMAVERGNMSGRDEPKARCLRRRMRKTKIMCLFRSTLIPLDGGMQRTEIDIPPLPMMRYNTGPNHDGYTRGPRHNKDLSVVWHHSEGTRDEGVVWARLLTRMVILDDVGDTRHTASETPRLAGWYVGKAKIGRAGS